MVEARTQGFTLVSDEEAARVKQQTSAAWFEAVVEGKMVILPSRPTLSKRMLDALWQHNMRIRTKTADERGFYVWAEEDDRPVPSDAEEMMESLAQ